MSTPPWVPDRREDLVAMPLPWHAKLRAELAADGGPSIVSPGEALAGVALTALEHRVVDGDVLVRDRAAPSRGWRALTPEFVDVWVRFARTGSDFFTAGPVSLDECGKAAELLRARVLREHDRAVAETPEADRRVAAHDADRRRADALAAVERDEAALAARRAALESGVVPEAVAEAPPAPARWWSR
ncbi:hypothetical protein [Pseudonocardia alni]|uniref:hypothetical protein n=1 Tax=Pseudonocardia alni TaxID=33907 RepID=UPI0033176E2A